jgi:glutathione S-transferase
LSLNQDGQTTHLYYHPLSSNSRRALLTAYHLGLDLELVVVDLSRGEHKTPEYLRLNPNGFPSSSTEDSICGSPTRSCNIWRINRLNRTFTPKMFRHVPMSIAGFFGRRVILPLAPALSFENGYRKRIVSGSGAPDPLEIARGEALLRAAALILDRHLAGKQWIAQDRLTLADFAIASPLMHTSVAQLPVAEFENLQAWFGRVQSLEAWTKSSV